MSEERGSVTVVTAAVIALLVVITMGAADVGHALVARAHAEQAADAAALAAAEEHGVLHGHGTVGGGDRVRGAQRRHPHGVCL